MITPGTHGRAHVGDLSAGGAFAWFSVDGHWHASAAVDAARITARLSRRFAASTDDIADVDALSTAAFLVQVTSRTSTAHGYMQLSHTAIFNFAMERCRNASSRDDARVIWLAIFHNGEYSISGFEK